MDGTYTEFHRQKQIADLCHRYGVPYIKQTDGNVNSLLDGMITAQSSIHIKPTSGLEVQVFVFQ